MNRFRYIFFLVTLFSIPNVVQLKNSMYFRNLQTEFCLASDGNEYVYTMECPSRSSRPQWQIMNDGTLRHVEGNLKCLDSDRNGNVYVKYCNNGNFQKWIVMNNKIRNKETQLCLDSSYSKSVYTKVCNDGDFQLWMLG